MANGRIVKSGDKSLALELERKGYAEAGRAGRERAGAMIRLNRNRTAAVRRRCPPGWRSCAVRPSTGSRRWVSPPPTMRTGGTPTSAPSQRRSSSPANWPPRTRAVPAGGYGLCHAAGVRERAFLARPVERRTRATRRARGQPDGAAPEPEARSLESHLARYAGFDEPGLCGAEHGPGRGRRGGGRSRRTWFWSSPSTWCFSRCRAEGPRCAIPRNLISGGRGSQAAVIETYLGRAGQPTSPTRSPRSWLGEGAVVDHYSSSRRATRLFTSRRCRRSRNAQSVLNSHNVSLGAALARNDVNSVLDAEGAECLLNGLFFAGGQQHVDNHTLLDHAKPHCHSRELYKGILAGRGAGFSTARSWSARTRRRPTRSRATGTCCSPGRGDQHQAATRDFRRRRPLHARRDGRAARPGGAVLHAVPGDPGRRSPAIC